MYSKTIKTEMNKTVYTNHRKGNPYAYRIRKFRP